MAREFSRPLIGPLSDGMVAAADPFRWIIERDHILTTLDGQEAEFAFSAALEPSQAFLSKRYKMTGPAIARRKEEIAAKLATRKNPAG